MSGPPPPGERLAPVLTGVLLALSFPPARLLLPVFVALVPFILFLEDRPAGRAGRWSAVRAGLLAGVVYHGLQLHWMVAALLRHSLLAIPAYLGAIAVLAGFVGTLAWAAHYVRDHAGVPAVVTVPLLWTAMEWLQGHVGAMSFPWLGLGAALTPFPRIAGVAEVVGSRGLTLWIAAVNGALAAAILRYRAGRPAAPVLAGLAVLVAAPSLYGIHRARVLELEPVARVAVVQPDIPPEVKLDPRVALDSSRAALDRLTRTLAGRGLDLVVWPEVALPADLERDPALVAWVRGLAAAVDAPILVGAYGVGPREPERAEPKPGGSEGPSGGVAYNSALLVEASEPAPTARYDKRRLVPFVERVPFTGPGTRGRAGEGRSGKRYYGGLARGRESALVAAGGTAYGVLICYESIFPALAREHRRGGARVLVNMTNDAWYGAEPWYARTTALWQHPAHLVLRAIETRTAVVRAANTGISMFVDPVGRVVDRTALFEPAVLAGTVSATPGVTPYVRWGDVPGTLATVGSVVLLLGAAARRWRGDGRGRRDPGTPAGASGRVGWAVDRAGSR